MKKIFRSIFRNILWRGKVSAWYRSLNFLMAMLARACCLNWINSQLCQYGGDRVIIALQMRLFGRFRMIPTEFIVTCFRKISQCIIDICFSFYDERKRNYSLIKLIILNLKIKFNISHWKFWNIQWSKFNYKH